MDRPVLAAFGALAMAVVLAPTACGSFGTADDPTVPPSSGDAASDPDGARPRDAASPDAEAGAPKDAAAEPVAVTCNGSNPCTCVADAKCTCPSNGGITCAMSCPTGGCTFTCQSNSKCDVTCGLAAPCTIDCVSNSTCRCLAGNCKCTGGGNCVQ